MLFPPNSRQKELSIDVTPDEICLPANRYWDILSSEGTVPAR